MLELVICDDEKNLRLHLRHILEPALELMGHSFHISEFDCGETFLLSREKDNYDIIFLDIEMKELDGIAAARKFRTENKAAVIIFVTAYPDFVFQGYEVRAFNYILKPYEKDKIVSCLKLALEELHRAAEQYYIMEQKSGSLKLPLQDIVYLMSARRSLMVYTKENSYSFYGKLNGAEAELPDYFVRIHNRYLVNINYVMALEGNTAVCGSVSLPVSRACKEGLAIAFAKYMLN